jgi:hypothetical protein
VEISAFRIPLDLLSGPDAGFVQLETDVMIPEIGGLRKRNGDVPIAKRRKNGWVANIFPGGDLPGCKAEGQPPRKEGYFRSDRPNSEAVAFKDGMSEREYGALEVYLRACFKLPHGDGDVISISRQTRDLMQWDS